MPIFPLADRSSPLVSSYEQHPAANYHTSVTSQHVSHKHCYGEDCLYQLGCAQDIPPEQKGSPDSLDCKFVDGNQGFLKLFGEDHFFKWLPADIAHYERNQDPCFFIKINDGLPVGEVASRKNPGDSLWTVSVKSPSENALSLLHDDIFDRLKGHIKEVQDDEDREDAIISEASTDCMSDGEDIVTVTRTVTRKESEDTSRTLWIGLQSTNTNYASLKSAFDEWVSEPNIRVLSRDAKRALYYWSREGFTGWYDSVPGCVKTGLAIWDWTKDAVEEWPASSIIRCRETLESFMDPAQTTASGKVQKVKAGIEWKLKADQLTIVDLSCPCVTAEAACSLFNICLSRFLRTQLRVQDVDGYHEISSDSTLSSRYAIHFRYEIEDHQSSPSYRERLHTMFEEPETEKNETSEVDFTGHTVINYTFEKQRKPILGE